MESYTEQPSNKPIQTLKSRLAQTVKPQRGGVLRIADTYAAPPRMGVPGRINVGGLYLEPIIDKFLRLDKAGRVIPHLTESWEYDKEGLQLSLYPMTV